ncbi:response regulator [uncultured Polaribacter sp.]|uniref:response regulator n=1 Tax=uncultured Polaribacter sp. TaxID=174711 RepID=UPI002609E915|nr:response regulator [uncultured Polaribacter sp.]
MFKRKLKILLIEDDRIEVLKLKRAISGGFDDYQITLADNGDDALNKLETFLPDIILLDLNMPDTNGIEFLTILKENEDLKHIPAIVLTTSDNKNDIFECYKLGISGYLLKPLRFEEYEKKIHILMNYLRMNESFPS